MSVQIHASLGTVNTARILYASHPGTISATTEAAGRAATNAGRIDTASWWQPTSAPATWTVSYGSAKTVDAVGIAAHTLSGAVVTIQALVASVWTTVLTFTPTDNSAILALFAPVSCTGVRITISAVKRIGVVYAGQALAMPVRGYVGLGLIDLGRQTVLTSYISEGGQLLARSIQRRGLSGSYSWQHLREDWYRANFDPFVVAARTNPFFIAARPSAYPTDCAYAWVDDNIVPERMGVAGNMVNVGFTAMGHADA